MADRPQTTGQVAVLSAVVVALGVALPALGAHTSDVTADAVAEAGGHLVISELQTGGASASDEFVELYNPTIAPMPLEGLELVYVTASGSTITRKASWPLGAPSMPPGGHLLVTNAAGIYASIGDATFATGVAASGGAWALRIQGAATAVDAVGWGTATAWLETRPAPAPAAGASLERRPGGDVGSGQDSDDNLADFLTRATPAPQNAASPPIVTASPSGSASASASGTAAASESPWPTPPTPPTSTATADATSPATAEPSPIPTITPTPTPAPTPAPLTIAAARGMPDGSRVTVRGVAITDHDFGDGGGYLVDDTAGVAVLPSGGAFARGTELIVTGTIDDRYAQRTIRTDAAGIAALGAASAPLARSLATGAIGESVEGTLVEVAGTIVGSQTTLSGGTAVQLDDGSGEVRIFVGDATGIDVAPWQSGAALRVRGAVGQRDSSGTGSAGYRVQPRDRADVLSLRLPETPSPSASPSPAATPVPSSAATPAPSASQMPLVTVAQARAAATNAKLRIRAVVTVPSGLVEAGSAVVQDASGGILVRLGSDAGSLRRGELVELSGMRSTKSGMLSLRVTLPPVHRGRAAEPYPVRTATGRAGERLEGRLVVIRGAISGRVTRSSSGSISFDLDDGSGPLRVVISSRTGISASGLAAGSWLEVRGALGQVTTGSQPLRGYRVWPRDRGDLTILAAAGRGGSALGGSSAGGSSSGGSGTGAAGEGGAWSGSAPTPPSPGTEPTLGGPSDPTGSSTPDPSVTTRRDDHGSGDAAAAGGSPAGRGVPRAPAGMLLVGLAGLTAGGAAAWRSGLIGRLTVPRDGAEADLVEPTRTDAGGRDDPDDMALTRLSVVDSPDRDRR